MRKPFRQLIALTVLLLSLTVQVSAVDIKVSVKPVEPFYSSRHPELVSGSDFAFHYKPEVTYLSPIKNAPLEFTSLGASWFQSTPALTQIKIELRFQTSGSFTDWYDLDTEIDTKEGNPSANYRTAFITTGPSTAYQYRVTLTTADQTKTPVLENLKFTFIKGESLGQKADLALSAFAYDQNSTHFETEEFLPLGHPELLVSHPELVSGSSKVVGTNSKILKQVQDDVMNGRGEGLVAAAELPLNTTGVTRIRNPGSIKSSNLPAVTKTTSVVPESSATKISGTPRGMTTTATELGQTGSDLKIISRAQWGADESIRIYNPATAVTAKLVSVDDNYLEKFADELIVVKKISTNEDGKPLTWPEAFPEKISKIVIHHTATTKNLDDPAQAVRDIYLWHTLTKGWGDIGYNYIIDQQGNIYEGRAGGEGVIGAHAGQGNNGSIGIAVLGNYEEQDPPEAVVSALIKLIKAKAQIHGIDTEGSSQFRGQDFPNIMGHRDIMSTSCPGDRLYALLPLIRKLTRNSHPELVSGSNKEVGKNGEILNQVQDDIPDFSFQFANSSTPVYQFDPKAKKSIDLEIKNTGKIAWNKNTYFQINPDQNAQTFLKNSEKLSTSVVGKTINPGEKAKIKIDLQATKISGSGILQLYPVLDGKNSIKKYLKFGVLVKDPPALPKYDYQVAGIFYSNYDYKKGDLIDVTIKLKNLGTEPWVKSGANKIALGSDSPRDHLNYLLPTPATRLADLQEDLVKFNQVGTFQFQIKIPSTDGITQEYFTPVIEGITWMTNKNSFLQFGNSHPELVSGSPQTNVILDPDPGSRAATATPKINVASTKLDLNAQPKPIRVDLAWRGSFATITANGNFSLSEGQNKLHTFKSGDLVQISFENSQFKITALNFSKIFSQNPRLVGENKDVILKVASWDRSGDDSRADYNEFRGVLEMLNYRDELHLINELNIEDYVKGLAEEPGTEPEEKIKAIAVIARTYARFYSEVTDKFPGAPFNLTDDPATSQKYLGYGYEKRSPITARLADATRGIYVTYLGRLIKTPFFSRSNGRTISASEKWGWTDTPFLKSVDDSFCDSKEFAGHGVGLSGCGATALAKTGKNFEEIIKYYYQGTELIKITNP